MKTSLKITLIIAALVFVAIMLNEGCTCKPCPDQAYVLFSPHGCPPAIIPEGYFDDDAANTLTPPTETEDDPTEGRDTGLNI